MAKFKTFNVFFNNPLPPVSVTQLKSEFKNNNDFKDNDLEKEVIPISDVIAVEKHPRMGFLKVQMKKRNNSEIGIGFPGFTIHSKHFIHFDPKSQQAFFFEGKATIQLIGPIVPGSPQRGFIKKDILAGQIPISYSTVDPNRRMVTYTSDHSI